MMFKGLTLRLTCLGLFAALCVSGHQRAQAQAGPDTSYRVLILDNLAPSRAQMAKKWLDGLHLPAPVYVTEENGQARVTYGDFASQSAADAARSAILNAEGVRSIGVVTTTPFRATPAPAATDGEVLTIFVREFKDRAQAEALKTKLQPRYGSVMIRQVGAFYEVLVGQYDAREAAVALGQLHQEGFSSAKTRPLPPAAPAAPQGLVVAPVEPVASGIEDKMLPVTQTEDWKKLSEDEKRKVVNNVELQFQIRKGDPLASQMFDISKRLEGLDSRVKKIVADYDSEKKSLEERRQGINSLTEEAENLIKLGDADKLKEARAKLQQALEMDKENVFGQRNIIQRRLEVIDAMSAGNDYPGSDKVAARKIASLQNQINQYQHSTDAHVLSQVAGMWYQIAELDPKMEATAKAQINSINQTITRLQEQSASETTEKETQLKQIIYGLAGGVGVLLVLVLLVWMRTHKRHKELMRKVQEITSIRPMRELEGGSPQLLGGGTESDIFSPVAPESAGDPLGGVLTAPPSPAKGKAAKKGKGAAPAAPAPAGDGLDDIFGGGASDGGDGLDDIFGSPAPAAAPKAAAPAPKAAPAAAPTAKAPEAAPASSDIDDIFGGLFADAKSDSAPAAQPVAKAEESSAGDTGPISFGDFLTASSEHESTASSQTVASDDLLSVFDEQPKSNGQEVDPLQDSPFARPLNGETSQGSTVDGYVKEDDTEIPAIKLDSTAVPSFGGFDFGGSGQASASAPQAETHDLPAFSFDDLVGATSVSAGPAGVALEFDQDAAGQKPAGWEGEYDFASLAVEANEPPRGAQQYLAFRKQEGSGKAHYAYRFGAVTGMVGIEFDLRCDDKNKFLLGFYIEKDGDFQQSIHTKILRSEAQTSPTIHMQGQSAPYLLGSWAHIKYEVDLNAGLVNGYIDSTHVVRDLPLTPNPGMLNTLSIRDNINTTGVLLLANIKVYPIQ